MGEERDLSRGGDSFMIEAERRKEGRHMKYRRLGKTNLMVSEIGFGGEWMARHSPEECKAVVLACEAQGINLLDCWMSDPRVRDSLGAALRGRRETWYIQGHLGAAWQDGHYVRTRDAAAVQAAFEDLLIRLETDYIDIGMIHNIDEEREWDMAANGSFLRCVQRLKEEGRIHHIGLSTHNPLIAQKAVESGVVEMVMFSLNPAYDLLPPSEDYSIYFAEEYDPSLRGMDPRRAELYRLCDQHDVGITVMKGYAGGRLFDAKRSPFGIAMTPVQCLHYCLTRPAVASVLVGYDTPEHVAQAAAYEQATPAEKDYAAVLAAAPLHAYGGQCLYCGSCQPCPAGIDIAMVNKLYDLAAMQPEVPELLKEHHRALRANAGDCSGCGVCESRCSLGVPIVERMAAARRAFL